MCVSILITSGNSLYGLCGAIYDMMMSWHGKTFRAIGPLWGGAPVTGNVDHLCFSLLTMHKLLTKVELPVIWTNKPMRRNSNNNGSWSNWIFQNRWCSTFLGACALCHSDSLKTKQPTCFFALYIEHVVNTYMVFWYSIVDVTIGNLE